MSTANPLEQLRRRMQPQATPAAFAALAEEHRRAGRLAEAIAVCREGLERYPTYVSARVTLGRALLDSGEVFDALGELERAVGQAPDNLAAVRALEAARVARADQPAERVEESAVFEVPAFAAAPLEDLPLTHGLTVTDTDGPSLAAWTTLPDVAPDLAPDVA
ncbi:MAG: tetratricopeptide repeat protein, partial [Acidobacteria bacterium]|nr:tetratricopeptide repeat protein [Acidobacteriota bacterium]